MRGIAAWVALVLALPAYAQPTGRDLWIGVLLRENEETGLTRQDGRVALRPVASLVEGRWHVAPHFDPEVDDRLRATAGRVPAEWLPLGRRLPGTWQGWLVDDRQLLVRASGALTPRPIFDELMIDTDLRVTPTRLDGWSAEIAGVAVEGQATVRPFATAIGARHRSLAAALTPALVDAEVERLAAAPESGRPPSPERRPTRRQWQRATRELEPAAHLIRADGTEVAYLEGRATVAGFTGGCGEAFSAVLATRRRGGSWRQVWHQVWAACDGLYIAHRPLAEIERDGRTCWAVAARYEDGINFWVGPPNTLDDYPDATCDIR